MKVTLKRCTIDPDEICGEAAALCYDSKKPQSALLHATESGHSSVTEHAVFTFEVEGVSRALLAQLTRHRLASFSVQSQRYVNMKEMPVVTPPSIAAEFDVLVRYEKLMEEIKDFYHFAIDRGIPKEDARFATPQGACTKLMVTMNARELCHFFSLRCCNRAQWEIREMADQMLAICLKAAPTIFRHAGPGCVSGPCPEGAKCCGHPRTIQEIVKEQEHEDH